MGKFNEFIVDEVFSEWRRNLFGLAIIGACAFCYWSITDQNKRNELTPKAFEVVRQINEPYNHATEDEWIKAYESIGLKYDSREPARLSNKQLQQIIDNYSK